MSVRMLGEHWASKMRGQSMRLLTLTDHNEIYQVREMGLSGLIEHGGPSVKVDVASTQK